MGSSYYHWYPDDQTLIWDRLPMTIAFTSLLSMVISEFINKKIGERLLLLLIVIGLISILFWIIKNDLRIYAWVQFYPLLAIPIVLVFFKTDQKKTKEYWLLLSAYVLAKVLEHYDYEVHDFLKVIGGHSLKHIASALGVMIFTKIHHSKGM